MFDHIKAVLFDLDGTLIDSAPDLAFAANKMRTDRHLDPLPLKDFRPMTGTGARGMLNVAFGMVIEDADFDVYKNEFFSNYEACMTAHTHPFSEVPGLIEKIVHAKIPWGVVTNKSRRFALPLIQSIPLFNSAGAIVCGDSTPYSKPHPEPLLEAARQLNIEPGLCLYVGDDERDVIAGRSAGMSVVAAAYGYLGVGKCVKDWNADAQIATPKSLLLLLNLPQMD